MANIMITKKCNLKCSYCFANEFVNKDEKDMSIENFIKAVDFITTNPDERIGLIGGEPTIHPKFKQMLEILIDDERVHEVTLFTNGINLEKYFKQLSNYKFNLLINCNSPNDIGENTYSKFFKNLDSLVNKYYMKDKITLGINMYKENFEYDYILELLKKYKFKHVRTSISTPNTDNLKSIDSIKYFNDMKQSVLNFYYTLLENDIIPFYDCNSLPACITTDREKDELYNLLEKLEDEDKNLLCDITNCEPVIDILPDLNAIRCFGLSKWNKVSIDEFDDIFELKAYFSNLFDVYGYNIVSSPHCKDCHRRKVAKCTGGCLVFKIDKILEAQRRVNEII